MHAEQEHIPFEHLVREADAVFADAENGKQVIVEYQGKPYRISPVRRGRSQRRSRRLTPNDPILGIIGIADSHGPGDVSLRVDDYLAQAYAAEFAQPPSNTSGEAPTGMPGSHSPETPHTPAPPDTSPSNHE